MAVQLIYKHQQVTERLLNERLQNSNRAAYVYPTGAGKTFPVLKYIEDQEAQSNGNTNVLILVPSLIIKNQYKKYIERYIDNGKNLMSRKRIRVATYQSLRQINAMQDLDVDVVVCDEAHRIGAETWEPEIDTLMDSQPNSKFIGITATPIRTDGRDMLYEKFADSIVYEMSMTEAIDGSKEGEVVLTGANYVRMLSALKGEVEKYGQLINEINDPNKKERVMKTYRKLESLVSRAPEMPQIMAQAMKNKNGKYVVFCADREDIQDKMQRASEIFGEVNGNISINYILSRSGKDDNFGKTPLVNRTTIENFEEAKEDGSLQLLFCVDMLDEGIHINGLDGIVMFKPTESWIVYSQEIGRIMSVDAKEDRVIVDAVNNWIRQIDTYTEIEHAIGRGNSRTNNSHYNFFKLESEEIELINLLRDINEQVKIRVPHNTYEEFIEFLKEHGRTPMSTFHRNGKVLTDKDLTEEQKEEKRLAKRWAYTTEKNILDEYAGRPIEEVPEEYREKIQTLRDFGLGLEERILHHNTVEEIIAFVKANGRLPKERIKKDGRKIERAEMSKEQREEANLCSRWRHSKAKRRMEEYAGIPIEEVPEEYREMIQSLRDVGLGVNESVNLYKEMINYINTYGRLPRSIIRRNGEKLKISDLTEKEVEEVRLRSRWAHSRQLKTVKQYMLGQIEEKDLPREEIDDIKKVSELLANFKPRATEQNLFERYIGFIEEYGRTPRITIREAGKALNIAEMTEEQKREKRLAREWEKSKERQMLEDSVGRTIEEIPEEDRESIQKLRNFGLGLEPEETHDVYDTFIGFVQAHGRTPRGNFGRYGRKLSVGELTPEEKQELDLHREWMDSEERRILDENVGKPIEEVPEEYRAKVQKLRELGLGLRQPTTYEKYVEFVETNGRAPRSTIKRDSRTLKREELTPEELEEVHLFANWRKSPEKKLLDQYAEQPIEDVPEEYRERIQRLRDLGIKGKTKGQKIKGRMQRAVVDNIASLEEVRQELAPGKTRGELR